MRHPKKVVDATEPLTVSVTQEILDEASRLGLNGRQLLALAIMRSGNPGAKAPVVVRGKSGFAKFNEGVIGIGGRASWWTTGDNKALVSQIIAAHEKATNATKGSLAAAIEAGDLLNSAKDALPKKGGWLRWLGHNLPNIPERTATLYMRLAANKNVIDRQRVAGAIEEGGLSATLAAAKALTAEKQVEDLLRDLVVDEIYTALKNTMAVGDMLELAQLILERNEKSDSPRTELDRRPPAPTVPMQRRV